MLRSLFLALMLASTLPGGGCSPTDTHMMPAPLAYREAQADALRSSPRYLLPPAPRSAIVPIFYATNRAPDGDGDRGPTYGSSDGRDIRLGAADVRLGPDGKGGEGSEGAWDLERLNRETLAGAQPAMSVARVEEFGLLDSDDQARRRFAREIDRSLAASTQNDIFVYVPGFNITFEAAVRRAAEFWHYLGRAGVFVTYAWPAHSHPFFYGSDFRCAADSAEGFTRFLCYLRQETGARRIHLLTSSAGGPMVTAALANLHARLAAPSTDLPGRTGLGQVVYAAPDQDIDGFRALLLCGAADTCDHITVYASASDLGLLLSRYLGSGNQTVGRLPDTLTDPDAALLRRISERVTVVDATNAVAHAGGGDFWAHSYWYLNPWVSSDVLAVLRDGRPPAARALDLTRDGAMWFFPDDYPERLRRAHDR